MINPIQTTIAAFAALTFAGTAVAQNEVQTAFSVDPTVSVEENYEGIRQAAAQACDEMHPRQMTSFSSAYNRVKKACRSTLIDAAVSALADPYLAALHEGREVQRQTFASKD